MESTIRSGCVGTVGNTPLIRLPFLSELTGSEILAKAEFLNPGGSVKDRAALGIIAAAEKAGLVHEGATVVEGSAGNTGIGLAHLCHTRGYNCIIVIPETQSPEKFAILEALGAEVVKVPAAPYSSDDHFTKIASRIAHDRENCLWANQFDNTANRRIHFETTGPEIWNQTDGNIDAFVTSVGTGGTLAGVAQYLKSRNPRLLTFVSDPLGSGLYNFIKSGEMRAEGNSITEGIGISRVTGNLKDAPIDDAVRVEDQECINMVFTLLKREGLFLGSSSGINVAGAVQVAKKLGPGKRIVTILCDGGGRYTSRLFNPQWLIEKGLSPQSIPGPA